MQVAAIERMLLVRSAPLSSHLKSQFFRPGTSHLSSLSRRLLVASIFPVEAWTDLGDTVEDPGALGEWQE